MPGSSSAVRIRALGPLDRDMQDQQDFAEGIRPDMGLHVRVVAADHRRRQERKSSALLDVHQLRVILAILARSVCVRWLNPGEEVLELMKVILGPDIKRMLVALGTLNPQPHERIREADRSGFHIVLEIAPDKNGWAAAIIFICPR